MAQNSEVPPAESPLSLSCGSLGPVGPVSGPELARLDRGEGLRSSEAGPGTARMVGEERKRTAEEVGSGGEAVKRTVNRCSGCRKRVGLMGFRCKCGELFCGEHRYSDRHECSYDYKAAGRVVIARENPVVRAAKILKV